MSSRWYYFDKAATFSNVVSFSNVISFVNFVIFDKLAKGNGVFINNELGLINSAI